MPDGGVTKETFSRMNTNEKLDVLFDQQSEIISNINSGFSCQERSEGCEIRFKSIERWQMRLSGAIFFAILIILPGIEITIRLLA